MCMRATKQDTQTLRILLLTALSAALIFLPYTGRAEKTESFNKDVKMVESYLQNLSTARARFVQTTHDGTQLVGTFYLQRPGKLRFEYDEPIKDFVVADGFFIYFYDAELGEQTNAPIGQTLADFFLRKDLSLEEDIKVESVRRKGGFLQVQLIQRSDPEAGSLTLGFKEDPLTLSKWRVVDGQGLITEVELFYMKTDIKHPADLFVYADPARGTSEFND
ncbi:MAG: outer membrane lipoprotein carrier protein LolA [Rhodospirillales bacterium]|nr:outer membrane lipoprotein carrier protein LolA [Alphaproteobacteria bacterium]USO05331.1 MAG: outer membrane lipoprotein carrier protein LolA [Rhodospirillales bacterium]